MPGQEQGIPPTNAAAVKRDSEFWFQDGTVTLIASNTEFRVYKGTLIEHSLVLADMFSLPQPSPHTPSSPSKSCEWGKIELSDHGMIDGCPVVRIHNTFDNVTSLLYALYDGP